MRPPRLPALLIDGPSVSTTSGNLQAVNNYWRLLEQGNEPWSHSRLKSELQNTVCMVECDFGKQFKGKKWREGREHKLKKKRLHCQGGSQLTCKYPPDVEQVLPPAKRRNPWISHRTPTLPLNLCQSLSWSILGLVQSIITSLKKHNFKEFT